MPHLCLDVCVWYEKLGDCAVSKKKGIRVHLNLEYTQEMRGEKEFIFYARAHNTRDKQNYFHILSVN